MGRKWANIVNKKGAADKLRGQIYTKVLFEIQKAVKSAGADPNSNFLLKIALEKAKKNNVPRDNIEKAIKRGIGGNDDGYAEVFYEGYGPNGVGIFVETSTNNVTRTAGAVRSYFNKVGGTLGTTGSLQFVFHRKSVFEFPQGKIDVDELTMELIDVGAEDVLLEDGYITVTGEMEAFGSLTKKLQELGITPEEANLERIPLVFKKVDDETYKANMKLIELIEADGDVTKVYHNIEFDERFQDL
jgi:YebC/PmpR family DNA-binding regulatory protein